MSDVVNVLLKNSIYLHKNESWLITNGSTKSCLLTMAHILLYYWKKYWYIQQFFWNTTMDQDLFELFSKVNFDQNLQRNLVKKEMKIATSHQKLHAGTYYIHMYIVRKYLNKKMALFKICQCHTLLEWKCQSSMSSDQGIH